MTKASRFCVLVGLPECVTRVRVLRFDEETVIVKSLSSCSDVSVVVSLEYFGELFERIGQGLDDESLVRGFTADLNSQSLSCIATTRALPSA